MSKIAVQSKVGQILMGYDLHRWLQDITNFPTVPPEFTLVTRFRTGIEEVLNALDGL